MNRNYPTVNSIVGWRPIFNGEDGRKIRRKDVGPIQKGRWKLPSAASTSRPEMIGSVIFGGIMPHRPMSCGWSQKQCLEMAERGHLHCEGCVKGEALYRWECAITGATYRDGTQRRREFLNKLTEAQKISLLRLCRAQILALKSGPPPSAGSSYGMRAAGDPAHS